MQPLSGIRVLGVTVFLAGPFRCMDLARFGADVINFATGQNRNFNIDALRHEIQLRLEKLPGEVALFIRVKRLETGLTGLDLEVVTCPQLYGVILPKVQSPADIHDLDELRVLASHLRQLGYHGIHLIHLMCRW